MATEQVGIQTRYGTCLTYALTPTSSGPWPAVMFYMDAGGIRPALLDMAQRLADSGYLVLLPDLFYRYGPYGPFVPKDVLAGDFRAILGPLMATTGNDKAAGVKTNSGENDRVIPTSRAARGSMAVFLDEGIGSLSVTPPPPVRYSPIRTR